MSQPIEARKQQLFLNKKPVANLEKMMPAGAVNPSATLSTTPWTEFSSEENLSPAKAQIPPQLTAVQPESHPLPEEIPDSKTGGKNAAPGTWQNFFGSCLQQMKPGFQQSAERLDVATSKLDACFNK